MNTASFSISITSDQDSKISYKINVPIHPKLNEIKVNAALNRNLVTA